MSVKRYDIDAYSHIEAANWDLVESEVGDFVYASDYDELRERVEWMLEIGETGRWLLSAESGSVFADALEESFASYEAARKAVEELL